MSDEELTRLDATGQAELVRSGRASPAELVEAAITRIEKLNPELGAVVTPLFDKARAQARAPDLPEGPFRGVPFLLKDLICASAGDPLYQGCRALKDAAFTPSDDTFLARCFREAGLVTVGKSNTPEFGLTATTEPEAFGPSRNPWNPEHSTGGSSGGSAAAVAARLVPIAHANDGGGSIRIPASECGLVGLKPSRGRVSLGPDYGEAWHGLVIEGVVTLSVRDSAAALDAISAPMLGDPYVAPPPERPYTEEASRDPGTLRIGLWTQLPGTSDPVHAECVAAAERAGRLLEELGHRVEVSHSPALDEDIGDAVQTLFTSHAARTLEEAGELIGRTLGPRDVEAYTWHLAERGRGVAASAYIAAVDELHRWSRGVARWWAEGFDLLLTPTIAEPPPPLGYLSNAADDPEELVERVFALIPFTPLFNVTGQPGISLPLHWSADGLPIGVQLVAAYAREDLLIRAAAQLERAAPWLDRRPPICG